MAIIKVNEEGISELKLLSSSITGAADELSEASASLMSSIDSFADDLGPHIDSISDAVEGIRAALDQAIDPIEGVSSKLNDLAGKYQAVVDNNRFQNVTASSGMASDTSSGGTTASSGGSSAASEGSKTTNTGLVGSKGMSEGYKGTLSSRYNNSTPNAKAVYDQMASTLKIKNSKLPSNQTPHYSPGSLLHPRGVYYNAQDDQHNPRGAGSTYFHELGHMVDNAATGYKGNISDTPEFRDALVSDANRIKEGYNKLDDDSKKAFINRIRADEYHSFSDLIDGLTQGEICGSYGHRRSYWSSPGKIQAEAFAHFFEASMGRKDKQAIFSTFFPKSFAMFNSMLDRIRA